MSSADETFLDVIEQTPRWTIRHNPLTEIPPVARFWPDQHGEWSPLLSRLRERLPVLTLGPHDPAALTGGGIWPRCMIEHAVLEAPPVGVVPVLYLPGVPARTLHTLAGSPAPSPPDLSLLADLRRRGVVWCQPDGRDWTVAAYLADGKTGLGIDVRSDAATQRSLQRALPLLADLPVSRLRADAPWRAADFDALAGLAPASQEPDLATLIAAGESATLEFKSSIRWDVRLGRENRGLEVAVLKTIAAFLNSEGGMLLIGVADDGEILGLERDQMLICKGPRNWDKLERHLDQLFQHHFGAALLPYLRLRFHDVNGKDVCRISASPAPDPAYVLKDRTGSDVELYVRAGNATISLGVRDAIAYIRTHRFERG